jgi:hypothetical protein
MSRLYSSFSCFAINKAHPIPFLTQGNQFCSNITQHRQAYFIALHIAVSKLHTFQRFYIQAGVPETSHFLRPLVFLVPDQVFWKYISSIFGPSLHYMSLWNTPEPEVQHDLCFHEQSKHNGQKSFGHHDININCHAKEQVNTFTAWQQIMPECSKLPHSQLKKD